MLQNDLYTIQQIEATDLQLHAELSLRPEHAIFKGHFPGQPVLPGVCMMEMVTAIVKNHFRKNFSIVSAPLLKFLLMIDPRVNPVLHFEINHSPAPDGLQVQGKIFAESRIFMKFNLVLADPVQ